MGKAIMMDEMFFDESTDDYELDDTDELLDLVDIYEYLESGKLRKRHNPFIDENGCPEPNAYGGGG